MLQVILHPLAPQGHLQQAPTPCASSAAALEAHLLPLLLPMLLQHTAFPSIAPQSHNPSHSVGFTTSSSCISGRLLCPNGSRLPHQPYALPSNMPVLLLQQE
jgi:hypothetical protein